MPASHHVARAEGVASRIVKDCAMQTLGEFISKALSVPNDQAFAERLGAPRWRFTSSERMLERVTAIAYAVRAAGCTSGDRVALMSENRIDWLAADFGILVAGCVVVPIFATLALDQVEYIIKDAEAKLVFVETEADADRLRKTCPSLPRCIVFDGTGPDSLAAFEAAGAAAAQADPSALAGFRSGSTPGDLAVLIYTSGTTGNPKGVMLSHQNLISNTMAGSTVLPEPLKGEKDVVLSVLPFGHIFEHTDALGFVNKGMKLYITQPNYLLADLKDARPVMMALVPRIFERVLAGIIGKAKAEGGLKAKLVPWALGVGRDYMSAQVDGRKPGAMLPLQYAIAQKLVLSKIKPQIGLDRLAFFASGSAPLHRDIALTFAAMGIPIVEGYGLTETSPIVTASRPESIRYGSVGKPVAGVEIKLASDGEILVKGPNVMQGYYHLPAEHPFTEDGWFMTGDIGEIDKDGYLFITDRKKELIKTSTGKYIAPGRVEAALKRSIYIGQCFVIGDGRSFPLALVSPNWDIIRKEFNIQDDVPSAAIAERADVRDLITKEVIEKTADLGSFEQVRKVALLPRDLTIEDGELSPTLKVKRRVDEKKFADIIDAAYKGAAVLAR
jgi:long-chain acyl-CoA synthetase